jgi:pyruvate dehydrogenase E2 component (dihydrolipoamide acetyltransferase)
MSMEVRLPELGENIETGKVVRVMVSPGDTVAEEQPIVELETDKAVIEVPSPAAGVVAEVKVSEGDDIEIGAVILTLSDKGDGVKKAEGEQRKDEEAKEEAAPSGDRDDDAAEEESPAGQPVEQTAPAAEKEPEMKEEEPAPSVAPPAATGDMAPAAPSVRRFAREIGIRIGEVPGTGPGGRISMDDVKRYAKTLNEQRAGAKCLMQGVEVEPLPDFTRWGEVERQAMSGIRKKTAEHLSYAWATIAHVTQFDEADVTDLEAMRRQYGPRAEAAGGKLTVTAILLKIVAAALKKFPRFNASIDMANKEIIFKKYVHIGVAVDTEHGLLVPVIRDVDRKNIITLSAELTAMAGKARDRKLSLEEMQGGNFSISNLGGIGGTGFAPVVNSPEVAILGVSRAVMKPVWRDGEFVPRLVMPLALSYDHRLIDGADAARFLRWVAEAVEQPFLLPLEG